MPTVYFWVRVRVRVWVLGLGLGRVVGNVDSGAPNLGVLARAFVRAGGTGSRAAIPWPSGCCCSSYCICRIMWLSALVCSPRA